MSERPNLVNRLRGIYTIPVNDGAGPLNGSDTFTRTFPVPPIHGEAADEIERLRRIVTDCGLDPDMPIPPPKLHTLEQRVEMLTGERDEWARFGRMMFRVALTLAAGLAIAVVLIFFLLTQAG